MITTISRSPTGTAASDTRHVLTHTLQPQSGIARPFTRRPCISGLDCAKAQNAFFLTSKAGGANPMLSMSIHGLLALRLAVQLLEVSDHSDNSRSTLHRLSDHGVRCLIADTRRLGPWTYPVDELGMPGTPPLSHAQLVTVRRIAGKVHSPTLRYGLIRDRNHLSPMLVVFDAVYGPCTRAIPGYGVLNDRCNIIFNAAEDPPVFTAPSCIGHTLPL